VDKIEAERIEKAEQLMQEFKDRLQEMTRDRDKWKKACLLLHTDCTVDYELFTEA